MAHERSIAPPPSQLPPTTLLRAEAQRAQPQDPAENPMAIEVYRCDPELSPNGRMVSYQVPHLEKMTILDALVYIQRYRDRSLAFRYACRLGMCGTCTVMVNDMPRWACRTSIERLPAGHYSHRTAAFFPGHQGRPGRLRTVFRQVSCGTGCLCAQGRTDRGRTYRTAVARAARHRPQPRVHHLWCLLRLLYDAHTRCGLSRSRSSKPGLHIGARFPRRQSP